MKFKMRNCCSEQNKHL